MGESSPEAFIKDLSPSDAAINSAEAVAKRLADLRETLDTAVELGDTQVVIETQETMDLLASVKGSLLE